MSERIPQRLRKTSEFKERVKNLKEKTQDLLEDIEKLRENPQNKNIIQKSGLALRTLLVSGKDTIIDAFKGLNNSPEESAVISPETINTQEYNIEYIVSHYPAIEDMKKSLNQYETLTNHKYSLLEELSATKKDVIEDINLLGFASEALDTKQKDLHASIQSIDKQLQSLNINQKLKNLIETYEKVEDISPGYMKGPGVESNLFKTIEDTVVRLNSLEEHNREITAQEAIVPISTAIPENLPTEEAYISQSISPDVKEREQEYDTILSDLDQGEVSEKAVEKKPPRTINLPKSIRENLMEKKTEYGVSLPVGSSLTIVDRDTNSSIAPERLYIYRSKNGSINTKKLAKKSLSREIVADNQERFVMQLHPQSPAVQVTINHVTAEIKIYLPDTDNNTSDSRNQRKTYLTWQ